MNAIAQYRHTVCCKTADNDYDVERKVHEKYKRQILSGLFVMMMRVDSHRIIFKKNDIKRLFNPEIIIFKVKLR